MVAWAGGVKWFLHAKGAAEPGRWGNIEIVKITPFTLEGRWGNGHRGSSLRWKQCSRVLTLRLVETGLFRQPGPLLFFKFFPYGTARHSTE